MSGSKRRKDCLKTGENKKYLETVETDMCQLEGVWVPFGRRVGECTFHNIYILVLDIYSQQLGGICHLNQYIWVSGLRNVCFVIYYIYAANNLYLFISTWEYHIWYP